MLRKLWLKIQSFRRYNCSCGYPIEAGWNWCGQNPCKVFKALEDYNLQQAVKEVKSKR